MVSILKETDVTPETSDTHQGQAINIYCTPTMHIGGTEWWSLWLGQIEQGVQSRRYIWKGTNSCHWERRK